ncbi:MAG: ester cyclase [Dehalococcoidia bacterium]
MSGREAMALIAQKWISLWTAPVDWALFYALHADDFEDASSAGRPNTRDGFAQGLQDLISAFPDIETRVEDLVIDTQRHRLAIRWSATGVNKSRYLGIGPTNKATHITGVEIIEVREDRIVRRWGEWDITDHGEA